MRRESSIGGARGVVRLRFPIGDDSDPVMTVDRRLKLGATTVPVTGAAAHFAEGLIKDFAMGFVLASARTVASATPPRFD